MRFKKLTNRDFDILQILWSSSTSLTALEIVKKNPDLTMNTVQAVLRKLLKEGFVKIDKIVYSGTVLSRSFAPAITSEEFILKQARENMQDLGTTNKSAFLIALFEDENNPKKTLTELEDLEAAIAEYKKKLRQK